MGDNTTENQVLGDSPNLLNNKQIRELLGINELQDLQIMPIEESETYTLYYSPEQSFEGQYGLVRKVVDGKTGTVMALKIPTGGNPEELLISTAMLEDEYTNGRRIESDFVVKTLDKVHIQSPQDQSPQAQLATLTAIAEGRTAEQETIIIPAILFEWINGAEIQLKDGKTRRETTYLKAKKNLSIPMRLRVLKDASLGLTAVNKEGVAHLDPNAGNVYLVTLPDGEIRGKIGDLGTSTDMSANPFEIVTKSSRGAPSTYAPERAHVFLLLHDALHRKCSEEEIARMLTENGFDGFVTPQTEEYSMAILAYEALTDSKYIQVPDAFKQQHDHTFPLRTQSRSNLSRLAEFHSLKTLLQEQGDIDNLGLLVDQEITKIESDQANIAQQLTTTLVRNYIDYHSLFLTQFTFEGSEQESALGKAVRDLVGENNEQAVVDIFRKAFAESPSDRYDTAEDFMDALTAYIPTT